MINGLRRGYWSKIIPQAALSMGTFDYAHFVSSRWVRERLVVLGPYLSLSGDTRDRTQLQC
jgi:hypothetical protein